MPNLDAFIARWQDSGAAERANKDTFLLELCDVLDVPRPSPTTGDSERDQYVFERDAKMPHPGGEITIGKVDLYKAGCFILEAKQGSEAGSKKLGTAKRETPAWNIAMRDAFGQALGYARSFDKPPPFLVTCDLGYCFDLYATFDGSSDYRAFPNAHSSRIFVRDLPKHRDTLRAIFTDPHAIDPSKQAAKVTREVAGYLANLAKKLEADGHAPELVATFLMRCLFTMFAEDVGLLPEESFTKAIRDFWIPSPPSFTGGIEQLWRTMNEGGHMFGVVGKILRFNGGLFASPAALPLDEHALRLL
ncbi:MAG TPA: type IIL restriction-modification enzyme MmeI, partial [Polyangiaceae bacterium]